ncbi:MULTISPECIES: assimilatory sulfite reductase (NADPH) flavoprotein subunit [Corallincola]|uniref:Sulfite reductase [NADPH] flavoprotein alpha-component n=2 Tax=Corallincola TaxID=1775176 RepID=A0ABY1WQU4_9GAMM|nr:MULTISPECIES: assimilatory sulfite reductase (NADPH) flavoprotein subunit [Corallincola]TAA47092.1 assimilatory sulfite reductase (NADPH) flavoprotein subunit [Corallincola spongiicola]TCI04743.1 assimilatory sulfite reductase (NADPH) flavoprotein subunit [Corallincola luteus]
MASKDNLLSALLSTEQQQRLQQAVGDFNPAQLTWVSGYLAGLANAGGVQATAGTAVTADAPAAGGALTILYGTQSGNGKAVASQLQAQAEAKGLPTKLVSMADFPVKQLKKETHLAIVVSTHGEGDPPDEAEELHALLGSKRAPKLDGLKFSVLALGDSSYEFYCQTGKDFDERIAKQGGSRLLDRVDCDVDFEAAAETWRNELVDVLAKELSAVHAPVQAGVSANTAVSATASQYDKKHPFTANLLANQKITGRDSIKDIRHVEIDLEGSGLAYRPGDSLGIWFENDVALVDELLTLLGLDGTTEVKLDDETFSLKDALISKYELTQLVPSFVKSYAESADNATLKGLADDATALREFIGDRQVIDVVREHPAKLTAEQLQSSLRRITPRLYSIASSQSEVEEEVHLTVGVVRYDAFGSEHLGGASGFLAERLEEGGDVKVFIENNDHFRLPENGDTPVIMVGPGTGIAPFRAFLQEREATDAEGDNWLLFGNPTFTQDFLYQTEIQRYVKSGVLSKVDLAWSRDQAHKIYVQDKIREQGAELYQWLESGAHFYVCGDASRMAKDVHEALISVVAEHGGKSQEDAEAYVTELRRAKRYQRDVY